MASVKRMSISYSGTTVDFAVNPQEYQYSRPQRASTYKTQNTNVIQQFGPDLGVITISGNINIPAPDLSGKADKSDITNWSNRVTALENKRPIKASSQDDAVAESQNSNNEYYW